MNAQDLKNSILQLAIQGKLVEQRAEEGTAKELVEKIKAEKEQLIKEKKIKKEKALPEITEDEIPFEIPESWKIVRLYEFCFLTDGIKVEGVSLPYLEAKYIRGKSEAKIKKSGKLVNKNEYVILVDGENSGEVFCIKEKGILGSTFKILNISKKMNLEYVIYILKFYKNLLKSSKRGAAIPHLDKRLFKSLVVGIPPIEEQRRIVAKIEELMPYIERYDKVYTKLEELNKKFPEDMQKSILQYAIQGKLVEQREEEGTAEELYKQIQEEKALLIKEKKIKKEKALSDITEDEIPFEIPESWRWVRLGNLFSISTGMTPLKTNPLFYEDGDIPWITSSQTGKKRIKVANNYITRFAIDNTSLKIYPKHTLIIAMYGQGKTRGQISELLIDATINQACAALESIVDEECLRNYTLYFQLYNYNISRMGAEGSAQPNLNLDKIRNILIPLPPLKEQKRIVEKIEELLPYCNQLIK